MVESPDLSSGDSGAKIPSQTVLLTQKGNHGKPRCLGPQPRRSGNALDLYLGGTVL